MNIMLWNGFSSNIYTIRDSTELSTSHSINAFPSKCWFWRVFALQPAEQKPYGEVSESFTLLEAQESVIHLNMSYLPF